MFSRPYGTFPIGGIRDPALKRRATINCPYRGTNDVAVFSRHRVLRHGGLVFGFKTCYYYYPEQDLTVIILMNTEEAQYRPIQSAIARMFIPDLPAAVDYE